VPAIAHSHTSGWSPAGIAALRPGESVLPPGGTVRASEMMVKCRRIHKIDVKAWPGESVMQGSGFGPNEAEDSRRFAVDGEGLVPAVRRSLGVGGFGRGSSPLFRRKGIVPAMQRWTQGSAAVWSTAFILSPLQLAHFDHFGN